MTSPHQPVFLGFEKADAINTLLERMGLVPDLGVFLSDHLLEVLRRQYSDLDIESIEFIGSGNCVVNGMETANHQVVHIHMLSLHLDVNVIVTARKERYSLNLYVILNAKLNGNKPGIKSDVMIKNQTFLGTVVSPFGKQGQDAESSPPLPP